MNGEKLAYYFLPKYSKTHDYQYYLDSVVYLQQFRNDPKNRNLAD